MCKSRGLRERAFSKGALQPAPSSSGASSAARGLVGDPGANPDIGAAPPPAGRGDAAAAWHSAAAFAAPRAVPTATSASNLAAIHASAMLKAPAFLQGHIKGTMDRQLGTELHGIGWQNGMPAMWLHSG